jgi:allantoicase
VDTAHFRGNFPQKVQVFAALQKEGEGVETAAVVADGSGLEWVEILAPQKTGPDQEHEYGSGELTNVQGAVYSHAKLVIHPDGGVKRFRVFGRRAA